MPIKLIGTIVMLVVITIFCGFNIGEEYCCDINFIYRKFENIPVFITILVSFLVGALVVLPFTIRRNKKVVKHQETSEIKTKPAVSKEEDKTIFKVMMQKKSPNPKDKKTDSSKQGENNTTAPV